MIKRLILALLVIVIVAVPMLTGCSTSTTSTTTTSTSSTSVVSSSSTTTAKPAQINIALSGTITTLDPTTMAGGGSTGLPTNVFETLFTYDTNNNMIGLLAESWSYSSDYLTLTVKLKKGIKFSSGDSFTAADVQFTYERHAQQPGSTASQLVAAKYSGMTIEDDYTVEFHFPAINVQFLPQTLVMPYVISKTQYDRLGEDAWVMDPAGTGPYKIAEYVEGQYVDLTYNQLYHGAKPQITDVHLVYTADAATRISQLQAGEVDMIQDVTGSSVAILEQAGYSRYDFVQPHAIALMFDTLDSSVPWAQLEVRQAIDYVIDKDALNTSLFGGVYQKGVWLLPWELGYDASLDPSYAVDIVKARELMAQAGYADGFEMDIYFPSFYSWGRDMIDYFASVLSQIGITVKPQALSDMGAMFSTIDGMHADPLKTGAYIFEVGWPGQPEPTINLTNGFYSTESNCLIKDTVLDALIKQARETADDTARAAVIQQAYQRVNDTLPAIPIFTEVLVYACESNIIYTPTFSGARADASNVFDLSFK